MQTRASWILRAAGGVAVVAAMVVLLLWLMGAFHAKLPAESPKPKWKLAQGATTYQVTARDVPVYESAVGSIRPVTETNVGSKILATVRVMHVTKAGQAFKKNDVLVELDDTDLRASLQQVEAALRSADATLSKATTDLARTKQLFAQKVASKEKLDADQTRFDTAKADVERLRQTVAGAKTALSYATIRAPIDGIVIDKRVNQGDLVSPGQVVVTMYDPARLQLIALVREQLAARLVIGSEVEVSLDAIGRQCEGRVDQIVPEARPGSRSFEVKVTGPCSPDVMSGMFGRLRVPVDARREIRIPARAVRRIGQLDFVFVVLDGGRLMRRFVRTGTCDATMCQILSGLDDGEVVVADASQVL